MPRSRPAFPLLLPLLVVSVCAHADDIARVEIKGGGGTQQRRDDVAGRIVVNREDLVRHGDASLADTLRRQPGVAIDGGRVQLRGLGGGRTQFLIDGEPAPPDFAPDSLAPDLVERVEILRSASADSSNQGIAGSINIVLRKAATTWRTAAKATGEHTAAGWAPGATLDLARPGDRWSGTLAAQLARTRRTGHATVDEQAATYARNTFERDSGTAERISLVPRLTGKPDSATTIAWHGLLDHVRGDNAGTAEEATLWGTPSTYPRNAYAARARTTTARSDISGDSRLAHETRVEWKAGMAHNRRTGDYRFVGSDAMGTPLWQRRVLSSATDDSAATSGKVRLAARGSHALSVGWDGTFTRRGETRRQLDADPAGAALGGLEQDYTARVRRLALYAQDEWAPLPTLDIYAGLRWESLHTETDGRDLAPVTSRASVPSPVAHLLWRLPGTKDQARLALSRSYKAPETRDLVPRRYTVNNGNGPTNPDVQGNPALRPELAWGIDAAYEAYFASDDMLAVSLYGRRIADVIVPRLFQDGDKWVAMQANAGRAGTHGIELDGRWHANPQAALRFTLSRNWSTVREVAGPDNRLGEQTALMANAGLDYRFDAAVTAGFSWNVQHGGTARTSATQWRERATLRQLNAHASWRMRGGATLRFTGSDLLDALPRETLRFADGDGHVRRATTGSGGRTLRLALELPLQSR